MSNPSKRIKSPATLVNLRGKALKSKPDVLAVGMPPTAASGYGTVWRNVLGRLHRDHGFEIPIYDLMCPVDLEHSITVEGYEFNIIPGGKTGPQGLIKHLEVNKYDIVLFLYDLWAFDPRMWDRVPGFSPYVPLDAPISPFARDVYHEHLKRARRAIAMSSFAEKELTAIGHKPAATIPHGVDCKLFTPVASEEEKNRLRRSFGLPPQGFLAGFIGANIGDRKQIPRLIEIFRDWTETYKVNDAWLYLHSRAQLEPGQSFGLNLLSLGSRGKIVTPEPHELVLTTERLSELYKCFDVYVTASAAEGCGLPILEAMASGVPCIVPDNSAQTEWVAGSGMVIDCPDSYISPHSGLNCKWGLVDRELFADGLQTYYWKPDKRASDGELSRVSMQENFDWDVLIEKKWVPFLEAV